MNLLSILCSCSLISHAVYELADGKKYLIKKETACKALYMDKSAEKILNGFILKTDAIP